MIATIRELALTIAKKVEAFDDLFPALDRFLEANAIPARQAFLTRLALEEMILNLIKHSRGGSDEIEVTLQRGAGKLLIAIEDDAAPFDPRAQTKKKFDQPLEDRPSGGMGIHLVSSLSDEIRYGRRAGRNRLEIDIRLAQ